MTVHSRSRAWATLTVVIFALCGAYLAIGGLWLLSYGDTTYYAVCGLALLGVAFLVHSGRQAALWLYTIVLLGSVAWAISEVGMDFWSLLPRCDLVILLGAWLLIPAVTRQIPAGTIAKLPLSAAVVISAATVVVAFMGDPGDRADSLPTDKIADNAMDATDQSHMPDGDWRAYGRTQRGDRFSPLAQITSRNVGALQVAWTLRTGDLKGPNDPGETTNEATPLAVNGTLYLCSTHQKLYAVDGASGKTKWVFDPHLYVNPGFQHLTCRGVSYHESSDTAVTSDGSPAPAGECLHRIFLPVNDGRLFAVDADSGKACPSFGQNGELDLRTPGMPYTKVGDYEPTSPPIVTDKLVIISGAVTDNGSIHEPSGVTRAFDVFTGKLVWVFDPGNPDPNQMPEDGHKFVANSPNSWITSSYDPKLGLIYIPTGVQTPDEWGGNRSADSERYASGVLALHADTGKLAWFYQTVHHDVWDMDVPSQMSLADVTQKDGTVIPALYAPTKTGNVFVLDRRDGHPIVDAPERPVPQGAAPGDHVSPTQPFSKLTFRPEELLTGKDMWGASLFDQLVCRIAFHQLDYRGTFTPPSERGTLVFPGNLGMFEWGGMAVDPQRQIAIANPIALPFVSQLVPRGPHNPLWPKDTGAGTGGESGLQPNYGIPYGVKLNPFLNPALTRIGLPLPCKRPPWGYMAGIDLRTNRIVWQHRNGTLRDSLEASPYRFIPLPPLTVGVPSLGGPLATAGNVAFLTSSMDRYIRAYDVTDGKILWQDRLPAGGQSTPMSYMANGRQYIVTYAGGHGSFGTKLGDYLIAYALPEHH
ncbi:glucose/quinate/shikimate family membrane-bound PQQ-dependent dehydrogenase [Brytella acorum]|uniref:Glucose/quinate/shikimate family membrane-bound PQQ-dependent dehydrogenase n=1 Tax=Brytella acorum TaxID=2959299 RepID=A0AA35US35_9PROT|nr:glucose/quinate/shikimate family membrane-bound PQQ-dependent dehydrogenase [Brytella acorum]MDF3624276.1 glucose/quinate/shikimate family membrane-bound PQQ-dependent dehydrogenase [Brytella acorum]CAI9121150.1 glucose/quinate/shikimate family membrane-bound PQQ-dependent dehydrogenase [Brytella acorum]